MKTSCSTSLIGLVMGNGGRGGGRGACTGRTIGNLSLIYTVTGRTMKVLGTDVQDLGIEPTAMNHAHCDAMQSF